MSLPWFFIGLILAFLVTRYYLLAGWERPTQTLVFKRGNTTFTFEGYTYKEAERIMDAWDRSSQ